MPCIQLENREGIRLLRLARPPVNALNLELLTELDEVTRVAAEDDNCHGVVLTGEGATFSAGLDLKLVPHYDPLTRTELARCLNRALWRLYTMPKPTAAAINGHAIAGGLILALACDFRVAAEGDYKLGLTEVAVGVPFPQVPLALVQAELDHHVARYLTLSGVTIGPHHPMATTLLDQVCAPAQVLEAAFSHVATAAQRPVYAQVKQQFKAAVFARIENVVKTEDDPMLSHWI
jgi:enoyl-CoA hydratase